MERKNNDSGERRLQKKQDLDISHSANKDEHIRIFTRLVSDSALTNEKTSAAVANQRHILTAQKWDISRPMSHCIASLSQ